MRRFTVAERRARLAARHHLAPAARAASVVEVARGLVALHATDAASVYLALWARMPEVDPAAVEDALYVQRSLVRFLGMRRTMFVVATELLPVVEAACTRALVPRERSRFARLLEQAGVAEDGERWLKQAEDGCASALAARGEATAVQLSSDVPALRQQIPLGKGRYARMQGLSTWVLFLLAADGRIVRGRPRGSWTSSQYRWAPLDAWLGGPLAPLEAVDARVELARRWLRAFGPATVADLTWWTGWTMGLAKQALAALRPAEVDLDGYPGIALADDLEPDAPAPPEPWVALLPALDPTPMGWSERDWYLGEHRATLFDRSGNIGPTVWADGRIVGGWAQRKDGQVTFRLLEDAGAAVTAAVEVEAARLAGWLAEVRVTPRFRTPLERKLTA